MEDEEWRWRGGGGTTEKEGSRCWLLTACSRDNDDVVTHLQDPIVTQDDLPDVAGVTNDAKYDICNGNEPQDTGERAAMLAPVRRG